VRVDLNILGKRNLKKRSLLEEILKTSRGSGAGKLLLRSQTPLDFGNQGGQQHSNNIPIIIIPGSVIAGNLSMANSKSFLQDGAYLNASQQNIGAVKERVVVEHKMSGSGGEKVLFEVHDSVTSFSDAQWKRVVAVFVNGHLWQFKDWQEKMSTDKQTAG
jgi:RNA pol II accessory factor, Cdc73 family, C-terminal